MKTRKQIWNDTIAEVRHKILVARKGRFISHQNYRASQLFVRSKSGVHMTAWLRPELGEEIG